MHIDVLGVGGGRVALVLTAVLARRVCDDQARRRLLPLLADHHRSPALSVVRDDLPVVVPEHVGGVEVERAGLDDAGQVDGGASVDVEVGVALYPHMGHCNGGQLRLDRGYRGCQYL